MMGAATKLPHLYWPYATGHSNFELAPPIFFMVPNRVIFGLRRLHTVPKLGYTQIPNLFSPESLQIAWNDHQGDLVAKLNQATVDTDDETRVPFHILLNAARRPEQAHVFNYASQAHNNHLFFLGLTTKSPQPEPSIGLTRRVERSFGSFDNLKQAIKAAADQIEGNGWVFVVEKPTKDLALLACNNAGTPYHFARYQNVDLNGAVDEDQLRTLEDTALALESEKNYNIALLALNLWQHAYVPEFGVDGREKYIDAWWNAIDWQAASKRLFDTLA